MYKQNHASPPDRVMIFTQMHSVLAVIGFNLAVWAVGLLICWFAGTPMHRALVFALPVSAGLGAILFSVRNLGSRLIVTGVAAASTAAVLFGFVWISGFRPGIGVYGPGDGFEPIAVAILTASYAALFVLIQFLCGLAHTKSGNR